MNTLNQQPLHKCEEKRLSSLFWVRSLLTELTGRLTLLKTLEARLAPGIHAGRVALSELTRSKRFTCGVVMIWIVAPLIEVAYILFDSTVKSDWYYVNLYWYLFTIGPQLKLLSWSIGAFLLFPTKWALRYVAMVIPTAATITKIIQLSAVTTNEAFHSAPSWMAIVCGLVGAITLLICADYLVYRKYHLKDGNVARILGIIDAPGIGDSGKMTILKVLSAESKNLNARI